jgi:hypothetical protein
MKYWRHREPILYGHEQCVDVVNQLCIVCHRHFIGVAVEYVERDTGDKRIAKPRVVPKQVTGSDARVGIVPCAPLVHHQFDVMLGVNLADDLPVIVNQLLHTRGIVKQLIPGVRRKLS